VENQAILSFSILGNNLLGVECGKKKIRILEMDEFKVVREINGINDRLFKGFYYKDIAFLSFYDEEKLIYFNTKNLNSQV